MPCPTAMRTKQTKAVGIPTIDLSESRSRISKSIVEACEEFGFFKVVNHGVPQEAIARLEQQGFDFFNKPADEKQRAGPAAPFGYGCKTIGPNGDMGELEYLLLHSDPAAIAERSISISNDPPTFSDGVNEYIERVRELACEILDLVGEGLWLANKSIFSSLIRDVHSDSLLRINHYPAVAEDSSSKSNNSSSSSRRIGFGEHSDPQILTLLRSNDVGGLQISLQDGLWAPVCPDSSAFYVLIGDAFQALTNGRFVSVRHRAMANNNSQKGRMSIMYFGAPPLNAWIAPLSEMMLPNDQPLYKPFTWAHYKTATYSTTLAHSRLDLFKAPAYPTPLPFPSHNTLPLPLPLPLSL